MTSSPRSHVNAGTTDEGDKTQQNRPRTRTRKVVEAEEDTTLLDGSRKVSLSILVELNKALVVSSRPAPNLRLVTLRSPVPQFHLCNLR